MHRLRALALATLTLAGCDPGVPQPANTVTAAPDPFLQRVRALPAGQRDGVLLRAIRDAGRDCQQVVRSEAIPDVAGAPAWAATCEDRGLWVVAFNPGGVATVTSGTDIARAQGR